MMSDDGEPTTVGPVRPTQLSRQQWREALLRSVREFKADALTDWAAALTYYAVLSIFPALLVLVSVLGLVGPAAVDPVRHTLTPVVPSQARQILNSAFDQVQGHSGTAGPLAIVGLLLAFWSASGYIGAFIRASNAIYDVPEGRPVWKTLPLRLGLTALIGVMLIASVIIVVVTGNFAHRVGNAMGVGETVVTVWNVAKWPVLVVLVSVMFAVLYTLSPNARHGGLRWVSAGGLVAVLGWLIVSGGFALYLSQFANYNKTYGTLAGVVVFLVWLWLSNMAILFGAEINAELERGRAIAAGQAPDAEPFLPLRDDRKLKDGGSLS